MYGCPPVPTKPKTQPAISAPTVSMSSGSDVTQSVCCAFTPRIIPWSLRLTAVQIREETRHPFMASKCWGSPDLCSIDRTNMHPAKGLSSKAEAILVNIGNIAISQDTKMEGSVIIHPSQGGGILTFRKRR